MQAASNAHHHLLHVNYLTPAGRGSVPLLICIFMKIDKRFSTGTHEGFLSPLPLPSTHGCSRPREEARLGLCMQLCFLAGAGSIPSDLFTTQTPPQNGETPQAHGTGSSRYHQPEMTFIFILKVKGMGGECTAGLVQNSQAEVGGWGVTKTQVGTWDPVPMSPSRLPGGCSPGPGQRETSLAQLKGV